MDVQALVVLVAVADSDAGLRLGRQLVAERLAACVQVLPGGVAMYHWQGEFVTEPQVQLLIKTTAERWDLLRTRICELHADVVPEILALPVWGGLPAYLAWLSDSVEPAPS